MNASPRVADIDGHRCLVVARGGWEAEYRQWIDRQGLTGLSIRVSDGDAEFLRDLPHLRVLVLSAGEVRDLRAVESLRDLESLTLNTPRRPKLALDFSAFPRLASFGGYWNDGFPSLFDCRRLARLFVFGPPDVDLTRFGALTTLERLELGQGRRLRSLAGIEQLQNLTFLGLYHQSAFADLSGLEAVPHLRELALETCRKVSSLDSIGGLRELHTLKIADCGRVASLHPLRSLHALERLFAWESTNVDDGDLSVLMELPALREVALAERRHYIPSAGEVTERLSRR